ncbi:MAG: DUF5671 domain-containing protein [Bryobacteraceae bacterium]
MDTADPQRFIEAAKREGASDQILIDLLRHEGWPDKEIYPAFRSYYEQRTGTTLPSRNASRERAKDAFLYLLSFFTLGAWTIALGSLAFTLVEAAFPDPLATARYANLRYSVSSELAAIIVGYPLYLLTLRLIWKDARQDPDKLDSPVRKWLTYIALLIAAGILIGDLIAFVSYFLRGELTVRFVLKVLAVLLIAGGVFWYYLGTLRGNWPTGRVFAAAASAAVMVALVLGFGRLGPPQAQRQIEADRQRAEDLQTIARNLHALWRAGDRGQTQLPDTLSGLNERGLRTADPITREPYEYRVFEGPEYQLCATFSTAGQGPVRSPRPNRFVAHPLGRHCFQLNAALPE